MDMTMTTTTPGAQVRRVSGMAGGCPAVSSDARFGEERGCAAESAGSDKIAGGGIQMPVTVSPSLSACGGGAKEFRSTHPVSPKPSQPIYGRTNSYGSKHQTHHSVLPGVCHAGGENADSQCGDRLPPVHVGLLQNTRPWRNAAEQGGAPADRFPRPPSTASSSTSGSSPRRCRRWSTPSTASPLSTSARRNRRADAGGKRLRAARKQSIF